MHRDSIRQINTLDARVAELESETAAATADATAAARAARAAEDKLQQAEAGERRRGKEAALQAWRMTAGAVRLRQVRSLYSPYLCPIYALSRPYLGPI